MTAPIIVWFRKDLRLEDQPAFYFACKQERPILPLFIWSPEEETEWPLGEASQWWLHHSLSQFTQDLKEKGLELIIRTGKSLDCLMEIIKESGADQVVWNRRYELESIKRDSFLKTSLHQKGIKAQSFNGSLLFEPVTIQNKQKKPFQVFTPFWKHCLSLSADLSPLPIPPTIKPYKEHLNSRSVEELNLLPKISWDLGLKKTWTPGTLGAKQHLTFAIQQVVVQYKQMRDFPAIRGTSQLSPYLHWGEISPRLIWQAVSQTITPSEVAEPYLRQLGWREFAHHLLYHFPHTPTQPLREEFTRFPWKKNETHLEAWKKGRTGYPIVDAGMRELWETGWMHNRVRMIVGSFLVKDLLIHWMEGARWFWDTLVDADLANNTLGWQWVGGCGADAAPYFRIFNPITQGVKFDPNGDYVRKWVPELSSLSNDWIHSPWEAPSDVLRGAGISLGIHYPHPIVDHKQARDEALEALKSIAKE